MKGFIFDLDGTLLDSMPSWQRQIDDMLIAKGITPPEDLLDRTKTLGLENATGMILQEFHLPDDPAVVYQQFQNNMEQLYCTTIPLKPGVRALLEHLQKAGASMVVATATARPLVEKVLQHHQLQDYFQSITTVAEVGIGKHDPRIYLVAAGKLGLLPQDCIVFEDSLKGIAARTRQAFKPWPFTKKPIQPNNRLCSRKPHAIFTISAISPSCMTIFTNKSEPDS